MRAHKRSRTSRPISIVRTHMRPALRGITRRKHRASHTPRDAVYNVCTTTDVCPARQIRARRTTIISPEHCVPANYIIMYLFYFRPRQRFRETKYDNTRAPPYNSARYTCILHRRTGGVFGMHPRSGVAVCASRDTSRPIAIILVRRRHVDGEIHFSSLRTIAVSVLSTFEHCGSMRRERGV